MLTSREQAAVQAVDESEVVALLRALVRTPSVNGDEEAAAQVVAEYLERAGIAPRLDYLEPGRPNVLADFGRGEGTTLLWNAHLDTVAIGNREAWSADPFGAELRDGRIIGRGASDDKGGVAVMGAA